jgi:hypothetical protein
MEAGSPEAIDWWRVRADEEARQLKAKNAEKQRRYRERVRADPERHAAYKAKRLEESRRYYQEHPETAREWKAANRERVRESKRKVRERMKEQDPEKLREADRQRYLRQTAKPEHRERRRASKERQRQTNLKLPEQQRVAAKKYIHGPDWEADYAAMWEAQDGKCYLCDRVLADDSSTHIDHDHRCCRAHKSCSYCRRGLACKQCNQIIGLAGDDPEKLRLVADRLEAVLATMPARIAAKPQPLTLWADDPVQVSLSPARPGRA